MRFARSVFILAGVWGIAVLTPLFFLVDVTGRPYPAPTDYPHFYYGFLAVAMAWQLAFLVIGRDPVRFRPMMIPAVCEKAFYVISLLTLYTKGSIEAGQLAVGGPDLLLGCLFVSAFVKTRKA